MNRVIYKNKDNSVSVLIPTQEVLDIVGLQAIAEKDVPAPYKYPIAWTTATDPDTGLTYENPSDWAEYNTPYWFTSESDIPSDRTARDAWEIDESMGDPDGFGGVSNEFTDEQLMQLYKAGVIE